MYRQINDFNFWCQKVLPLVYDESLSYYEVLCKMGDYMNNMVDNESALKDMIDGTNKTVGECQSDIKVLQDVLNGVKNGDYVELYIDSLSNWIDNNLQELMKKCVGFVQFELDDNGYFVALIPETWDFLEFDTIADGQIKNYGHLVIDY